MNDLPPPRPSLPPPPPTDPPMAPPTPPPTAPQTPGSPQARTVPPPAPPMWAWDQASQPRAGSVGVLDHDAAISAVGVTKRYGTLRAVDGVDFHVPKGSVYGLIGPNGAGKSTLMSIAASLLLPNAGRVRVEGHDPITQSDEVRCRIGYMPDGLGVYEGMSVAEYIEFFAAAYKIPRSEWPALTEGLLELVELEVKRTASVNSLSRGMKQRLSLARALVHDPALLILDEPASGLDPRARIELRHLITNLNTMGKTILVSSHILTELQEVCSHVGIMEAGRLLASGSPAEILEQARAVERVQATFADGTSEIIDLPEGMSRSEMLRQLVLEDPREVVAYTDAGQGLEDVFLTVTKGIVQ